MDLETLRHSTSHILAAAVKNLYPEVKFGIGPAIENGFYYDFGGLKISDDDLPQIEKEMQKIISTKLPFVRKEISVGEGRNLFKDQKYKLELINELAADNNLRFTIYELNGFVDLCKGPHVKNTSAIKTFKLTHIAGAYWKGDEKNPMLTRIYGTAFLTQKELNHYLWQQEEAKKRDHRKIGKELKLFSFHDEAAGEAFFHPKGWIVFNILVDFWREVHQKNGYQEIRTPVLLNAELWKRSGHYQMKYPMYYTEIEGIEWGIKPMNCPGGMLIYNEEIHSYKELPLRVGELGLVHRHELSGVLHGLMRVREFTQDDAHIYCTPEQLKDELKNIIKLCDEIYSVFGLPYHIEFSTRPEKSVGTDEAWQLSEKLMQEVLNEEKIDFKLNPGDGAFYGPKFDFHLEDSLGRTWQCGTIQVDFNLPERFDLTYIDEEGQKKRPVMIHRTIYGSLERFIGILTEHFAGAFPVWLSPVQVVVIPIAERHTGYAKKIELRMRNEGIRVEVDERDETMQAKIRDAQLQKIPYMLIVGDKEEKAKTVSERGRSGKDYGQIKIEEFIANIKKEIEDKIIN